MAAPVAAPQTAPAQRADPQRAATRRGPQGPGGVRATVDRLQRAVGNRGVHRLLQTQTRLIQPKLTVGPADDQYEREADRVAADVMRMPDPASAGAIAQRSTLRVQRVCPNCEEGETQVQPKCAECEAEEQSVQMKPAGPVLRAPEQVSRKCAACEAKEKEEEEGAPLQAKPEPVLRAPAQISRACSECEGQQRMSEDGAPVQRKSDPTEEQSEEDQGLLQAKHDERDRADDRPPVSADVDAYVSGSRGGGRPLLPPTREYFETRFGHDFGDVRIHADSRAAQAASEIHALAFTAGSDIHFAAGRFQPGTEHGDRLLAHELTHTIQQTGGRPAAATTPASAPAGPTSSPVAAPESAAAAATPVAPAPDTATIPTVASTMARTAAATDASGETVDGASGAAPAMPSAVATPRGAAAPMISRTPEPSVQRTPSAAEIVDGIESTTRTAARAAGGAVATAGGVVGEAVSTVGDGLADAGEAAGAAARGVANAAGDAAAGVGQAAVAATGTVTSSAAQAVDFLATEAGQLATGLGESLGAPVTITSAGLEIRIPRVCPIDAITQAFDLPSIDKEWMVPVFAIPIGPVALTGSIGVAGHLQPLAEVQLGPICLNGIHIVINVLTNTFSISGSVSITAAAALGAEARGGLRGALTLEGLVPVGGVLVPVKVPLAGVEGGIAGLVRGIAAGTLTIGGGLSISGGVIALNVSRTLDLGLAGDLFLGAYAQLDVRGKNVCRIYWQPYEWHGEIAGSIGLGLDLSIAPGRSPAIVPVITPTFTRIPFDQIPLALSRGGFSDDCPIIDKLCEVLKDHDLLPSQNGGVWNWAGPYGPGPRLAGPLDVYQRNPGIPSGASCRGACGPDCVTCAETPSYVYVDPVTGDVWEYTAFQDCPSNEGCRQHDAAFDWAAAEKGETGPGAIVMPWHMAANIECACNNLAGNCIAWIFGLPPYDSRLYSADTATPISLGGGGGTTTGACKTDFPNAPDCIASYPDRDAILTAWGLPNGLIDFHDCVVAADYTAASTLLCEGGPGKVWHCRATDLGSGQEVVVGITECICCQPDNAVGSSWGQPEVVLDPSMSIELVLDLCDRGLIARDVCAPIEAAPSAAVPSLDNRTWFLADRAIRAGDFPTALTAVLDALTARGQINRSVADWTYVARSDEGEGQTIFAWIEDPVTHERRARAPVAVEIYDPAFTDVSWLFSSMMHEYVHVNQVLAGLPAEEFDPVTDDQLPEFEARDEVEAYLWEIEHALGTGVITDPARLRDLGERLSSEFDEMTPALQAQYQVRYDAAQQRIIDTLARGGPAMTVADARRIVQESSQKIAELLARRPGNEAVIDAEIEKVRKAREQAMVELVLVENPVIQVVRPGEPGTYRVPTVDADGRVRYLHGGIQVAWHLAQTTTSAYTLGGALGVGGEVAVSGTAIQGRVHPFPPDVDFDEHIHVVAPTRDEAALLAARRIIAGILRISGGPVPGRPDLEFRHLLTFPLGGARGGSMNLRGVQLPGADRVLARRIAELNGGNINTFWRGFLADGRFTAITRVVFVSAATPDGRELLTAKSSDDFNLAFLEDPGAIPPTRLAQFAFEMCCAALKETRKKNWLKAGKRAYNYFSTIGDLANMARLEPVFRGVEAEMEQQATVVDGVAYVLSSKDMKITQANTRILTLTEARDQIERVADALLRRMPGSDSTRIAERLRKVASEMRARNARGHLEQNDTQAAEFDRQSVAIRLLINNGVQATVEPIIEASVYPACKNRKACDAAKETR
jgi:hypothetical protein